MVTENTFDASKVATLTELMDVNEKLIKETVKLREEIKKLKKEIEDQKKLKGGTHA